MNLKPPGVVQSGAIIVYIAKKPMGSFLPGTYWPGSEFISSQFDADCLPNLRVSTANDINTTNAVRLSIHWQLLRTSSPDIRILTALDALGDYRYGQKLLGEIAGVCRDTTVQTLKRLAKASRVTKQRGIIRLDERQKGRYW